MNRDSANRHAALSSAERDALAARFALRLCAQLPENAVGLPHGVADRLAAARARALQAMPQVAAVRQVQWHTALAGAGGARRAGTGGDGGAWWKLASALPLLVLLAGLGAIAWWEQAERADAAAEVDAALLADYVPPDAYADPGFAEFLRRETRQP
ncbi:MAG: DUF3619 family protein [Pseudomonadota bacterium]